MKMANLALLALVAVAGLSLAPNADAHRTGTHEERSIHAAKKAASKHRLAEKGRCPMRHIRKHYQGRIAFRCS